MPRYLMFTVLVLLCGIVFLAKDRLELQSEIHGLRNHVLKLSNVIDDWKNEVTLLTGKIEACQATNATNHTLSAHQDGLRIDTETPRLPETPASSFEISARIAGVSSLITLSAEEKTQIASAAAAKNGLSDEILQGVLGDERFVNYAKKRAEFEESMRQEVSENELFSLSRKLGLSQEQEPRIKEIITLSREKFMPRRGTPEWTALPVGERERAIVLLRKEIARQKFLSENLRSILNDGQYNKLLEIQSSSSAAQSHTGFLDEAATETKKVE